MFDFLKQRQKTPGNRQSQRGLKSTDYNIPAGGRYNKVHFYLIVHRRYTQSPSLYSAYDVTISKLSKKK